MELEKLYDPVATLYDIEHEGFVSDIPFYLEEAKKVQGSVLELGAGTGRVTLECAKVGVEIVALEISKGMLDVARKKSSELPEDVANRITWLEGDMRKFELGRQFPLVFIPFRSFQHLETRSDQEACLECVSRHLEKSGRFVLSLFAPSYQRLANRQMFNSLGTIELPDGCRLSRTERVTHDYVNQLITVEWTYDVVDAKGNIKRNVWTFPMRYLWRFETELLLEKAGLEVETIYGDYNRCAFDHNGEMLFVARKS
ncbi:class I SAM-dependent methyltransferase [candidate division WOR-3 bacterium]|nr:class I SAM-dependent methyltransferase [candidate division WOR-3 bacterium]